MKEPSPVTFSVLAVLSAVPSSRLNHGGHGEHGGRTEVTQRMELVSEKRSLIMKREHLDEPQMGRSHGG